MRDDPQPGTWIRLTRRGVPKGRWHAIAGWRDGRLMLGCTTRDRVFGWALSTVGEYRVERTDVRPPMDVCRHCARTQPHPMLALLRGHLVV